MIHITFKKGHQVIKTLCFNSVDLDFVNNINHSSLTLLSKIENYILSDPVMFFDENLDEFKYGMYFQDEENGYFRYKKSKNDNEIK